MIKNLRSLIQEKFPLELRVQIELLSRRRDLVNEEKHQELIKLLQSFNVEGVVPLGPGTNRYAFKLNGFVVKVATDHDGKIDNLKEFKMAKRLYPYVTKIYEVSENGTLLVAEYIQPFASYTEMCNYAEQIRDILTKLSSVYLIGDVGVTSKNFANWGLRIGSDDPVCLDFAYVYEVSSELFICQHCKTNSMLVPNKDFTELHCPNKACNKRYLFEDIRARIGNDIHAHEIGDLTQEGYRVVESGVSTELDESRSNYLARRKEKTKESKKQVEPEVVYEPFVMDTPNYSDIKGGKTMSIFENSKAAAESMMNGTPMFQFSNGLIIPAKAVAVIPKDQNVKIVKASECNHVPDEDGREEFSGNISDEAPITMEPYEDNEEEEGVAFTGSIDPDVTVVPAIPIEQEPQEVKRAPATTVLRYPEQPKQADNNKIVKSIPSAPAHVPAKKPEASKPEYKVVELAPTPKPAPRLFNDNFLRNAEKAFSKLSNRIGGHMHELDVKDTVSSHIRDRKMYPENFYKAIQNAVYRSLMIFCQFDEKDVPNHSGNGTHKEFTPPATFEGTPFQDTAVFVSRFWNDRDVNSVENAYEIMMTYRDHYDDCRGIQLAWLPIFEERLKQKLPIDATGAKMIVDIIRDNWCVLEEDDVEETPPEPNEPQPETSQEPIEEEIAFSGSFGSMNIPEQVDVAQNPAEEPDEYDEEETGEDEDYPFCVEIFYEDEYDVVKVNSGDAFGPISIPFYVKLDDVKVDDQNTIPSIADDRNGVWDWLIHMVPDMMFRTRNPEKWLEVNTYNSETNQLRMVIMSENNGEYIMGIYYLVGIFIIDDDGEPHSTSDPELLAKINKLIRDESGYGCISHLQRSLSMDDLIRDEEYINDMVVIEEDEDPDQYEDPDDPWDNYDPEDFPETEPYVEDENDPMREATKAAIKMLLGIPNENNQPIDQEQQQAPVDPEPEEEFVTEKPSVEEPNPTPSSQQPQQTTTNTTGVYKPIRRKK